VSNSLLEEAVWLHRAGRRADAAKIYEAILRQSPRDFYALYFLGFSHFESGDFEHAAQLIGEAVRVNPQSPDALYNLGCALQRLQRHDHAVAAFDGALAIRPDYVEALVNRGAALVALTKYEPAAASIDRALQLSPDDVEALANRAALWFEIRHYNRAAEDFAKVLERAPDFPCARGNLALARAYCCDWRLAQQDREQITAALRAGKPAIPPHAAVLLLDHPGDQLLSARQWAASQSSAASPVQARRSTGGHPRLRIGYVSADFHQHATAMLIVGVLEQHDRERFEIFAISFGPDDGSALRKRIVAGCDHFFDVSSATDQEIAQRMAELEIDIAVDLKGFTLHCRPGIFARRPAPIQVNYLGHPGTTGAEYIDYILADRTVIPPDHEQYYSERVVVVPGCYQANDARRAIGKVPSRGDAGLPDRGFVFCCFNNGCKITKEVFAVWMRLLHAVEGSVLWLLAGNDDATSNLRRAARLAGIDDNRLVFAPHLEPESHLARHALADLFLDTWPCCAHTAASDALWAGLPLLTIEGPTFAGRVAASALQAVGVPELVTHSPHEYEKCALELARSPEVVARLKGRVGRRCSTHPLFDTAGFTQNLERAYLQMLNHHRVGARPTAFGYWPV
jgi:protein O-GlcNAc transferase